MISIEELVSTLKRIELLKNNTDSPEEKATADLIITNLNNMIRQLNAFIDSPDFKEMVKDYVHNSEKV